MVLLKAPIEPRNASRSPMRERVASSEFYCDEIELRARSSNLSMSPDRGRGKTPLSMRTTGVSRSPARSSTGGSVNGDVHKSPLSDTGENSLGGRKSSWRDRVIDRPDQVREGVKPVLSDEHKMYGDGKFKSPYVGPKQSFENAKKPTSVQELQMQRDELLRKFNELNDQLSGLEASEVSPPGYEPIQRFTPDRNMERPSDFIREPGLAHIKDHSMYEDQFAGQIKRGPGSDQRRSVDSDQNSHDSYANDWRGRDQYSSPDHRGHAKIAQNGARGKLPHHVHHNTRLEVANMNKRLCRPISGGAPFVICNNCFELLILPGNFIAKQKSQQVNCGGCSTVVSFDLHLKSFDPLSFRSKRNPLIPVDVTPRSSEISDESRPKHHRSILTTATSTNIGSYDFDAGGYTVHSIGSEASSLTKGPNFDSSLADNNLGFGHSRFSMEGRISDAASVPSSKPNSDAGGHAFSKDSTLNPSIADKNLGFVPPSSRFSVDEHISDAGSVRSSQPNTSEMPMMGHPPPGSPLHSDFDHSAEYHISKAAEKQVIDKDASLDVPVDTADATETEVPYNEGPTTGETQYSGYIPRESPVSGNDKVAPIRIVELLNGLDSISSSGSQRRAEVYVNGQAISPRSIKKAEMFAGPIQPGDYWYDPKAGFWGVMGHPCSGIIPPFIQEFSLPMPEDCSRGYSTVYVNGRELSKQDLDLLAGRKLPTTRDRRYVVDIYGQVLDEQTKDFVVSLGRLAPTVERKKRGFGMKVPDQLAD